jgi:hypothetical protein
MARGLKIAHERSDGTKVDQSITNSQGGVGGIPQWITTDGVKTIKVQYVTDAGTQHANAYIIAQKGAKQFLVANAVGAVNGATHSNASVTVCTLVNTNPPTVAGTMCISGYDTSNSAFNAKRITNKHVYDFSNNKYRYRGSNNLATATFANVIVH